MSRESHEIRKKIALARKTQAMNEHMKSKMHQEKIINSASEQKQKYNFEIEKSVLAGKRADLCISAAKLAAAGCVCVFSVFLISKAATAPRSDFSVTVKSDEKYSHMAVGKAERIFKAFRNKDKAELKALTGRLDEFGIQDCESLIGRFTTFPDFKQASVSSPKTDPCIYYLALTGEDGLQIQLVLRRINGALDLEGICLN
ncbi:MAG TPA: hypothetical protein DET40_10565 [Lentisphaeria bacterium]|nr:MAG: hypothetical protein A2X45_09710 [Lentisphaerae bacterium GWF2_50_93]HCE43980.1 hypothetical protein [Lentisphaeria bacterium]